MSSEKPFEAIYWHSCGEIRSLSSSQNKVREKIFEQLGLMGHLRKAALPPIEVPCIKSPLFFYFLNANPIEIYFVLKIPNKTLICLMAHYFKLD